MYERSSGFATNDHVGVLCGHSDDGVQSRGMTGCQIENDGGCGWEVLREKKEHRRLHKEKLQVTRIERVDCQIVRRARRSVNPSNFNCGANVISG